MLKKYFVSVIIILAIVSHLGLACAAEPIMGNAVFTSADLKAGKTTITLDFEPSAVEILCYENNAGESAGTPSYNRYPASIRIDSTGCVDSQYVPVSGSGDYPVRFSWRSYGYASTPVIYDFRMVGKTALDKNVVTFSWKDQPSESYPVIQPISRFEGSLKVYYVAYPKSAGDIVTRYGGSPKYLTFEISGQEFLSGEKKFNLGFDPGGIEALFFRAYDVTGNRITDAWDCIFSTGSFDGSIISMRRAGGGATPYQYLFNASDHLYFDAIWEVFKVTNGITLFNYNARIKAYLEKDGIRLMWEELKLEPLKKVTNFKGKIVLYFMIYPK